MKNVFNLTKTYSETYW